MGLKWKVCNTKYKYADSPVADCIWFHIKQQTMKEMSRDNDCIFDRDNLFHIIIKQLIKCSRTKK